MYCTPASPVFFRRARVHFDTSTPYRATSFRSTAAGSFDSGTDPVT